MLFYTLDVVHGRLNPIGRDGIVVGTVLWNKDRKPLSVITRSDFSGTDLLSSEDDLELVEAFLAELREAAAEPQRLGQYLQSVFENASLSLVLEEAEPLEATDAAEAYERMAARF